MCETEGVYIPLFLQYWWMDAVCADKRWDVALAYDDAGGITAVMPYLKGCRVGMRYILPPQLTPFTGPWYRYPSAALSERERLDFEEHAAQQLLDNIDRQHASVFIQCFSPQITNWLPFYHRGYKQTTRYTYRIDDISDTQCVFDMLTPHRRRKIRQWDGQVAFDVLSSEDAAWFADFHAAYWRAKGQRDLLPRELMVRLMASAISRDAGVVLRLMDGSGEVVAAAFAVYDDLCAYLLQSALAPSRHRNGHKEVLLWKLIEWLSPHTKAFDFEGSMVKSIEYFNRSFGTRQVPYFQIERYSNILIEWYMRLRK